MKRFLAVVTLLSMCFMIAGCEPAESSKPEGGKTPAMEGKGGPPAGAPGLDPKAAAEGKKPADEKPADEKPADEKPADEKPADEKPADEKPADEKEE